MTTQEIYDYFKKYEAEEKSHLIAIAKIARSIIPVLKDKEMNHVAKQLEEVFFLADGMNEEHNKWMKEHFMELILAMKGDIK